MRRFAAVTTCNAAGYESYGRRMVGSFIDCWPQDVPLMLYHEDFEPAAPADRVDRRDLLAASPALAAFKARHADNPRAHGLVKPWRRIRWRGFSMPVPLRSRKSNYRWQAVRFAHKPFAIFHAARNTDADVLFWVDADTRFFASVDRAELESLSPPDTLLSCLRRPKHSECGFVAYNLRHPGMVAFLADFERFYTEDRLFAEREFHDSYLFDRAREHAEAAGARVYDIGEGIGWRAHHVLINSRLGRYMDHMKGHRKAAGYSSAEDLVIERAEAYWGPSP